MYTHTQPAQPSTLGHYLLSMADVMQRDFQRLMAAETTVNMSPFGAAAITTTGFPISRERVCELLGFSSLCENSYDSIAASDPMTQFASVMTVSYTHLLPGPAPLPVRGCTWLAPWGFQ